MPWCFSSQSQQISLAQMVLNRGHSTTACTFFSSMHTPSDDNTYTMVKLPLLGHDAQLMLQSCQHRFHMTYILLHVAGIHQDVISINHYIPVEHSWGVGQPIGHYQMLIVPRGHGEGSLPIVPFLNMHTVVSTS